MQKLFRHFSFALVIVSAVSGGAHAQSAKAPATAAPAIVGHWSGIAKSDAGQMNIEVAIEQKAGKFVGSVETAHGAWPLVSVAVDKTIWTVTFSREDGGPNGTMKGTITDGVYSGAWDNSPMAVGTFDVRKK